MGVEGPYTRLAHEALTRSARSLSLSLSLSSLSSLSLPLSLFTPPRELQAMQSELDESANEQPPVQLQRRRHIKSLLMRKLMGDKDQDARECPYSILGVVSDASQDEIKDAFQRLIRPDAHGQRSESDLIAAFSLLRHPLKRSRYDRFGLCDMDLVVDGLFLGRYTHSTSGSCSSMSAVCIYQLLIRLRVFFGAGY